MKFVCIFPELRNAHLVKDIGYIPYYLQDKGYDSEIWCFDEDDYSLKDEIPGVEIVKIKGGNKYTKFLRLMKKIVLEDFDLGMSMHLDLDSCFYALAAKMTGKDFFVKCDLGSHRYIQRFSFLNKLYNKILSRLCNLIWVETKFIKDFLSEKFSGNYVNIPTGVPPSDVKKRKGKYMLTVGRLDSKQKNIKDLVKAINLIKEDLEGWKIYFIGNGKPIKHPIIEYTGPIFDRKKLYEHFAKSRIFLSSSLFEAYAHVFGEAAYFGNVIVGYEVGSARDVTRDEKFGRLCDVGDVEKLAENIKFYVQNYDLLKSQNKELMRRRKEHEWPVILDRFLEELSLSTD